jgi:hypothetical protein
VTLAPPEGRLYEVRLVVQGDTERVTPEDLGKRLRAKGADGLRQRCSDLAVRAAFSDRAEVSAVVNDWNGAAAMIRLFTLSSLKGGEGWDWLGATMSVEPVRPRTDSTEQGRTATNAA